jgi:hypothetical protein
MVPRLRPSLLALLMAPVIGIWLVITAGSATAVDASTAPIDIDFEQDTTSPPSPPFVSVDSPLLSFDVIDYPGGSSDCTPVECTFPGDAGLIQTKGFEDSKAVIASTFVTRGLRITLAQPTQRLSLMIGDADQQPPAGQTPPRAVLAGFFDGVFIASVSIQGDNDSLADQSLNLQGFVINSAIVQWQHPDGTPRTGWPEVVDNVHSDPLCSVFGTNGANTLTGTADVDVICGGPGNDTLNGLQDNDLLFGNTGRDTINGGSGSDQMLGGTQTDTCNGGPNADTATSCEIRTSVP